MSIAHNIIYLFIAARLSLLDPSKSKVIGFVTSAPKLNCHVSNPSILRQLLHRRPSLQQQLHRRPFRKSSTHLLGTLCRCIRVSSPKLSHQSWNNASHQESCPLSHTLCSLFGVRPAVCPPSTSVSIQTMEPSSSIVRR